MTKKEALQIFENRKVRTIWDDEREEWYFSVVDVIAVLTDSADPNAYWRKLKQRLIFKRILAYLKTKPPENKFGVGIIHSALADQSFAYRRHWYNICGIDVYNLLASYILADIKRTVLCSGNKLGK